MVDALSGITAIVYPLGVAIADVLELDVHELVYNPTVDKYLNKKKEFECLNNENDKAE